MTYLPEHQPPCRGRLGTSLSCRKNRAENEALADLRKIFGKAQPERGILRLVLDVGLRAVVAGGGLGVPFAVRGLVLDRLGSRVHALLGGHASVRSRPRAVLRDRLGT